MQHSYSGDIVAWANQQAQLIRAGRFGELDIEHIAEEIEDVGKSEHRELASRMAVLLTHLLKWQYQPERRGKSWQRTITTQRKSLALRLNKTPSLKANLNDDLWWEDVWADTLTQTTRETALSFEVFPETCPWTLKQILDADGWPSD